MDNSKKLFAVEFAGSRGENSDDLFGPMSETIYVISDSYDGAVKKAQIWSETRMEEKTGILTRDGSLDFSKIENKTPQITSIRIAPNTVLF